MNKLLQKLKSPFLRVSLSEKILFTKHLSMMTKSGMGNVESLKLVRRQVEGKGFSKILDNLIYEVENGQSLSTALGKYKSIFGNLFINIVALGETSGTLPENLDYLSAELKKSRELHSKIRSAFIYPVVVMFFTVGVVIMLVFFVLPRLTTIFQGLNVNLPITTRILIGMANFMQAYWPYVGGGIILIVILWTFLIRIHKVRRVIHRIVLVLPVVGNISKNYNMTTMSRTLGLLLKSGMKIVEAVLTTSEVVTNIIYKEALRESAEGIKRGEPLYNYLERNTAIIPPTLSHMVEVGERTGNLDANLLYLAEFYENEVDETVRNLSSIIEPVLLIFMGIIVGFVAVSIITPIYQISQGV